MKAQRSLRAKLLWGVSLCTILTALTGGALVYTLFRRQLYRQLDHSLTDKLRFLRAACSQQGDKVVFDTSEALWRRVHDPDDPEYFSVHLPDGTVILRSESLGEGDLPEVGRDSFEPVFALTRLPQGQEGHCAGQLFYPEQSDGTSAPITVHVVVAHDSGRIVAALLRLRELLLGVGAVTTALLLAATFMIVSRNLRPLRSLARQIEDVSVGDREARFELADAPSELDPVVRRLNAMMDRVAAAIENERQFTASAAHELRNPLAGIRSQIEVALGRPRPGEELRETLERVSEIELRLERVVENLLMLAKLQAGQMKVAPGPVDLAALLRRTWKPHFEEAEEKNLKVSWDCEAHLPPASTSETLLQIVLRNLMDNALSYTPTGGAICIQLKAEKGGQLIRIGNDSPGLQADELEKLFQRFWRKSEAREGEHVHAGLGLDLCRRVTKVLGAGLEARLADEMLWLEVQIPAGESK